MTALKTTAVTRRNPAMMKTSVMGATGADQKPAAPMSARALLRVELLETRDVFRLPAALRATHDATTMTTPAMPTSPAQPNTDISTIPGPVAGGMGPGPGTGNVDITLYTVHK